MTKAQLDRAVARVTGESVREIRRRGFSIADPDEPDYDPEPSQPQLIDWDIVQQARYVLLVAQRQRPIAA